MAGEDYANWREIVELVERGQGSEPFKTIEHGFRDDRRLAVVGTAVNNAMADRDRQPPAGLFPKEQQSFL